MRKPYIVSGASLVDQRVKHLPPMWESWVRSLGWEDPLEKEVVTHSSILAWRIPWMEEPTVHGVTKKSDTTERLHLYSQQKQDRELTLAQIMNSLLPNSDLN